MPLNHVKSGRLFEFIKDSDDLILLIDPVVKTKKTKTPRVALFQSDENVSTDAVRTCMSILEIPPKQ